MFPTTRRSLIGGTAVVLVLVVAGFAWSTQPVEQASYEVPLRQIQMLGANAPGTATVATEAASAFSATNGGEWKVFSWNPQTNTPHYLYGSGVQVASSFQESNATDLVSAAKGVLQANAGVFKADLANLRFGSAPRVGGKSAVHFQQTYHMLDVVGGNVHLTFTDGGRLIAGGSDFYPDITVDPNPSVTTSAAEDIARRGVPYNPQTDSVEPGSRLFVLPVPKSDTEVDYHLAWRVRVHTADPVGIWATWVDAHDGTVLWRENEVEFANFTGTTQGLVEEPSYCEGQGSMAMPYLRIQVQGVGNTNADATGHWSLGYSGTDPHQVTADLYGPYVDVNNMAAGGTQGVFTGTATPGTPLQVSFTDGNSQRDEKDVFVAVNRIHDFFQLVDPTFPYVNQQIVANVSRASTCNAYWNGTINFYAAGGGCANTGTIMGVVQHEFGHGIQNAILGGQGNEGLGEGNGDVLANLMTMESIIGRGFYQNQCTTGIRDSNNHLQYPGDVVGQEIHNAGRVIAGFHWDALQGFVSAMGTQPGRIYAAKLWHFGRILEHPMYQTDQVLATFIADDNDGDLTNGTPNYDILCTAAQNHGFSCPEITVGVSIQHTPLATRTQSGDAVATAVIRSTIAPLVADSLRLKYRIDGGAQVSVRLTPTTNPDEYSGTIPGLHAPNQVEYYLRARDTAGNTKSTPVYSFDVATAYENFESGNVWSVNQEGSDNAATGVWIQADPVGTSAQPEDDHTPAPGVKCWVTGNANPGDADGTNDVDGGTTTLYSSNFDLTGASMAKAKYYRWYSNDKGGAPGEDNWVVQVRNNGGAWTDVERTTTASNGWTQVQFDLKAVFGNSLGTVQFKFVASDLVNPSLVEAAVDDFELLATLGSPSESPEQRGAPLRFALMGSRPNPVRGGASIGFEVPAASHVKLRVFDASGRLLRVLADGDFQPGSHVVSWDGRDAAGHGVASGMYYCRMESGGFTASRGIVVSR